MHCTVQLLEKLGFTISLPKSALEPIRQIVTHDQLHGNETTPARGEGSADCQQLLTSTIKGSNHSTSVGLSDWQVVSSPSSSVTYSSAPPTSTDPDIQSFRFLQLTSDTEPGFQGQTKVVGLSAAV